MKLAHFETLAPVCPLCRRQGSDHALHLAVVEQESRGDIGAGILQCTACGAEYPIIEGLPILVTDVRQFVQQNLFYLMARDDLTPAVEGLLGDAAGPGSALDSIRQHVSSYMWDHWGDRDPQGFAAVPGDAMPGGVVRVLEEGLALAGALPPGPVLDIGCGAGRTVTELAQRTGAMTLGIDISIPLARAGRRAVVGGTVNYGLRQAGLVYDRRTYPTGQDEDSRADIWICDVLSLPFRNDTFALTNALNVVDCMVDPRAGLMEMSRVMKPGAASILSVPFDWSGHVTPVEAWLGGHSQRANHAGRPEAILDMLLSSGPLAAGGLRRQGEPREIPWHVRLHNRSCMHYSACLVAARESME